MYLRLTAACLGFTVLMAGTASADYYVVRNETTKECKIVEEEPSEKVWIQVGDMTFKTREEAEEKLTVICKDVKE